MEYDKNARYRERNEGNRASPNAEKIPRGLMICAASILQDVLLKVIHLATLLLQLPRLCLYMTLFTRALPPGRQFEGILRLSVNLIMTGIGDEARGGGGGGARTDYRRA